MSDTAEVMDVFFNGRPSGTAKRLALAEELLRQGLNLYGNPSTSHYWSDVRAFLKQSNPKVEGT